MAAIPGGPVVSLQWEEDVGMRTRDMDKKPVVRLASSAIDRSAWCGQRWTTSQDEPRHCGDPSVWVGVTGLSFGKSIPCEICHHTLQGDVT